MPRLLPPELIEKIRKKEEENSIDNRIPLYLPDDNIQSNGEHESEETSGIYIIDLVD